MEIPREGAQLLQPRPVPAHKTRLPKCYLKRALPPWCSQPQLISAWSLADSQYGLQYCLPSGVVQLQGGWAHFFVPVLI